MMKSAAIGVDNNKPLHILLADDHTLVRETMADLLQRLGPNVNVIEAETFAVAADIVATTNLNLAILDMVMPGMNRLEGLKQLHRDKPELPVVILSGLAQPRDVVDAMNLGAAGFIPKTIGGRGLLSALQMILSGERYIPPMALAHFSEPVVNESAAKQRQQYKLSRREHEVFQLLATGRSNRSIADLLGVQEVTVKAHLRSLFKKLGVSNRLEAAMLTLDKQSEQNE